MNGIRLAACYAFPPNSRGYCGKSSFPAVLRSSLQAAGAARDAALAPELKCFKAHYAYLSLIARENRMEPFDREVVEAFWIGNRLLDNVSHDALRSFMTRDLFKVDGSIGAKGRARAEKLAASLPEGMLPHHSFNPLYIRFVSDSVERSVENLDSCCITWGRVLSVSPESATLMRNSIAIDAQGRFIIRPMESKVSLESCGMRFVDDAAEGDVLSVHWGMAIEKLSPERAAALERYTRMNVDVLARSHAQMPDEK
jgi:hydrogenase maturation factor